MKKSGRKPDGHIECLIQQLKNDFIKLKSLYEFPRLFLISHFSELRNKINNSFASIEISTNVDNIKKLDKNWSQMIEKINELKADYLGQLLPDANLFAASAISHDDIDMIEKKLFIVIQSNKLNEIEALKSEINAKIFFLEKILFKNKTIVFLDKRNSKVELLNSKMDKNTTAGKLLIVSNEYLDANSIQMLNNSSDNIPLTSKSLRFKLHMSFMKENLDDNQINETKVQDLCDLNEVNFASCNFSKIDDDAFSRLKELKVINLAHNELQELNKDLFNQLEKLKSIDLSFNKLKLVEKCFDNCKLLNFINLSHNQLTSINLNGLKELTDLDLSNNKLTSLAFKGTVKLSSLNLSYNRLEALDSDLFNNLLKLEIIFLNDNLLRTLPPNLFEKDLQSLKHINLSNNKFKMFHRRNFSKYPIIW